MIEHLLARCPALLLTLIVGLVGSSSAFGSVTIVIQNGDSPGVGFNDTTLVAPVGGNNGTTLGQQRLNAFQFAANVWGATLSSGPPITIHASWSSSMPCTQNAGTLGSAGAVNIRKDFANAQFAGTWYSVALANNLSGSDLNGITAEINAQFNVLVGTAGCLQASPWYLGLDGNHGGGVDLVTVLLHEFAHGLGFQTFTNSSTGAQASGFPSVYDRFLFDDTTGKNWVQMTDAERVASAINTGNLVWIGPRVTSDAASVLGTPRLRVNSPAGIAGNYQVGTAVFGPRLFSPGIIGNLVQSLPNDACSAITNSGAVSGKIAVVDRGTCNFTVKVRNAQDAGAIGVVVVNNVATPPLITMAGSDATITIPSVLITQADGTTIRGQLGSGVNASILLDTSVAAGTDPSGRPLLFAPNPIQGGSSVSHWDDTAFPNQLMEPNISDDLTHSVMPPEDLTFSLLRDIGWRSGSLLSPTVQFSQSTFSVTEGTSTLSVQVTRTGDTTGASTVDYATSDAAAANPCSTTGVGASSRCDYLTTLGTLQFAAGETTKTISIPIIDDVYAEGVVGESFAITLTNATGATLGAPATATLTINDNDSANGTSNPIDVAAFFVRQHYVDFFTREPDTSGLNFWTNEITQCGADAACTDLKRINVSAAFFLSIEFQQTGYLVHRVYKASYGDATGTSTLGGTHQLPVPIVRLNEFLFDTQRIGRGVIVGQTGWEQVLENNKQAFCGEFVQRTRFATAFASTLTPAQFVDALFAKAAVTPSGTERQTAIDEFGSDVTSADPAARGRALRRVAENGTLSQQEFNRAFVLMQFFGYLRRNPNDPQDSDYTGYDFWLGKLNQFNGNFVNAEMVKAFITSVEYRRRFAP